MSEAVIDRVAFDSLKDSVGADYIAEVVNAFTEEVPQLLAQLHRAFLANDAETFRRAAHSIKSNAATFGAMPLSALARELEYAARENRLNEIGNRLEVLNDSVRCVIEELKGMCV